MTLSIVILAAGQGKRMYSQLPKVLHPLAGKPLLEHVVRTAEKLSPAQPPVIVYGHQGETVRHTLAGLNVQWVEQTQQLGTGHALQQALPFIPNNHRVLVLYGDVPLISSETLTQFIKNTPQDQLGIITAHFSDPKAFGRIIRNSQNKIVDIIEEKDLTAEQHSIQEINTGIYLFPENYLAKNLSRLQNNNAQQEFYLTDIIKLAAEDNIPITHITSSPEEVTGCNDRAQLAALERIYQRQLTEKLMRQGVTFLDPSRFDLRGELSIGQDVTIDINVICEGRVVIGNGCKIGPHVILRNTTLADGVEVKANSILDGAEIGEKSLIGPFARIRPGTITAANTHIGNFVEIKNSWIKEGSKVNHLTYIGDSDVGKQVNVGAGTITCNYDGVNKHKTIIEDNAFIGSNTSLVAPVTIGTGAYIGSGSTITRNAPPHQLTVCRAREQRSIKNWKKPEKKES